MHRRPRPLVVLGLCLLAGACATPSVEGPTRSADTRTGAPGQQPFTATAETPEAARASIAVARSLHDVAWSGDGSRFGFVDRTGGYVLDPADGDVEHARKDMGISTSTEN